MSISKLRCKSAIGHHENAQTTKEKRTTTNSTNCSGGNKTSSNCPNSIAATSTAAAAAAAATTKVVSAGIAYQQAYLPQTSLLKIEPFVPSTRLRRPIDRSNSTLSSTYLKRSSGVSLSISTAQLNDCKSVTSAVSILDKHVVRPIAYLRKHPGKVVTRQRSKSTSSSASNRPVAAALNDNPSPMSSISTNGAIVTSQPNGICRISRLPKEQEKLPDRINYDRRGLTAIPIFENEANLRLLSLQHNLINIFHIPKDPAPNAATKAVDGIQQNNLSCGNSATNRCNSRHMKTNHCRTNSTNVYGSTPPSVTAQPQPQPPPQPPLSTYPLPLTTSAQVSHLLNRNNLLQKQMNYNVPHLTATQQASQYRFAIKKSKSFVSNYSKHLHIIKRNLHKSYFTKTEADKVATLRAANLKSFDSGASGLTTDSTSTLVTSEVDEEDQMQQLEIKNKQLWASYGMIFQNLVFLDLYDNQIERIANLDGLPTLSVLLLGKNRITDISGLVSLRDTLRVLDLHGNKITNISNKINCLHELKSLNLAGNQIRQINQNDFNGLLNLKELNLKRNKIKRINGFQNLSALERLWLCHNDLHKVEDMSSIAKAINLIEVTIENNPVSLAGDCVSFLVSYLPHLESLSQMPITDQVRRAAMAWRKNKDMSDANYSHLSTDVFNSFRREEVISNARTNWELLRSQQTVQNTLRNQRCTKRRELAKINESNEIVVGYVELPDTIKLPPIQKNQQQQKQPPTQDNTHGETEPNCTHHSGSSGSSLGPNVDSSSSFYSSDNEVPPLLEVERARVKKCQMPTSMRARITETEEKSNHKQQLTTDTLTSGIEKCVGITPEATTMSTTSGATTNTTETASTTAEQSDASHSLTVFNDNQTNGVASLKSAINSGSTIQAQTESTLHTTVIATTTAILVSTKSRATTPTNSITGFNSAPSLGIPVHNMSSNTEVSTKVPETNVTGAKAVAASSCKRYMQSSLIRSEAIGGNSAAGNGVTSKASTHDSTLVKSNAGLQSQTHCNAVATISNTPTASNIVSIVTPVIVTAASKTTALVPTAALATATTPAATKPSGTEREREQGGDYLIEICGRYLNIYGHGALRFIDKQWNAAKANDVHTLNFSYINFNNITVVLSRIKMRFPHAENFVFRETNINSLGQLNALAELQGIASLCIDPEGNAITTKDLWRQYAIYRLSHWGLKQLNGIDVADEEVSKSNAIYAGLSELVLWSMPELMLQPLLARLRLDETCMASKMSPKGWLMKAENKSLRLVVGKEALQWKKSSASNNISQHQQQQYYASDVPAGGGSVATANLALGTRERGKMHFALMMENTCNAVEKLHKLETLWPSLLLDIVRNTLLDYSQLDVYLRNLMSEILK